MPVAVPWCMASYPSPEAGIPNLENIQSTEYEPPIHEECGLAVICAEDGLPLDEDGINALREAHLAVGHRGQQQQGQISSNENGFINYNGDGQVAEAIPKSVLPRFRGHGPIGLAHSRWMSFGDNSPENRQPIITGQEGNQFALAINGNTQYIQRLEAKYGIQMGANSSDTRFLAELLAQIQAETGWPIEQCIEHLTEEDEVKYSAFSGLVVQRNKVVAFRDEQGVRPLLYGSLDIKGRKHFMMGSETIAFEKAGATVEGEILPGMIMTWTPEGKTVIKAGGYEHVRQCVFEAIYFMNPKSRLPVEGVPPEQWPVVEDIRKQIGYMLGKQNREFMHERQIDHIIPIPRSGVPATEGFARGAQMEDRYLELFTRITDTRAFIQGDNSENTMHAVLLKLGLNPALFPDNPELHDIPIGKIDIASLPTESPLFQLLQGKRIASVDDSIIHGDSSKAVNKWLMSVGAVPDVNVSSIPAVRKQCHLGSDMKRPENMLFNRKGGILDDMAEEIHTNTLIYPEAADFIKAIRRAMNKQFFASQNTETMCAKNHLCTGCFTGEHIPQTIFAEETIKIFDRKRDGVPLAA